MLDLTRHVHTVNVALSRFCDAFDDPTSTSLVREQLARDAFMAVLALAQLLHGASIDHERRSATIERTQLAVDELLDALEPYVTAQEAETRRVLLDGEPLDSALARMFA
jgi:hypothetical protein